MLFGNGALYGKDTRREADNARLADNFLAYYNAKQTLYKHVLASVDKGHSAVDETRKILQVSLPQSNQDIEDGKNQAEIEEVLRERRFQGLAPGDLLRLFEKVGEASAVKLIRDAVERPQFMIYRKTASSNGE